LGLVNYFGAIKGVVDVIARFSSEILPPKVVEILVEMGTTQTLKE